MSLSLARRSREQMFSRPRSRGAELYFNGCCLFWATARGRFRKVPFFLRHIWYALAG
jgi:hypothetical protein